MRRYGKRRHDDESETRGWKAHNTASKAATRRPSKRTERRDARRASAEEAGRPSSRDSVGVAERREVNFKGFAYSFPKALRDLGFEDTSWGNDVCASCERGNLRVWVAQPKVGDREFSEMRRYSVEKRSGPADMKLVFETDDLRELVAFLKKTIR